MHPPEVEERLLAGRGRAELVLALDDAKPLGEEEMKVLLNGDGLLRGINKAHDPAEAAGEYIGLTLIEPEAAGGLAEALEATWSATRRSTTRTASRSTPTAAGGSASRPSAASSGSRSTISATWTRAREVAWRC